MATKTSVQKPLEEKVTLSTGSFFENYGSTILGFVVVLVLGSFLFNVFRGNKNQDKNPEVGSGAETTAEVTQVPGDVKEGQTHTVVKGEDLWKIAEKYYGSGYNWVDIVKVNKLTNPGVVEVGQVLSIPQVSPIQPKEVTPTQKAPEEVKPTVNATPQPTQAPSADEYTVVHGDNLWNIAVKMYSSGYKWVDIARANNLKNPNIIHAGNKLSIPR